MKLIPHRHEFTCPDVIYLRRRAWKIYGAQFAVVLLGIIALNIWGRRAENQAREELYNTPNEN